VHRIALLQSELLGALPGDHALNRVLANLNHNSSHDLAQVDLLNRTRQLVSRGKFHILISAEKSEHSLAGDSRIVTAEPFQFAPEIRPAKRIEQILNTWQIQMLLADNQIVALAYQRNEVQP
jgi:hypothetical protein